jgi:hypothetical protein
VPSLDLPVFEIKHKSENDPRVTLSKEAFRILANYGKQQALILFTSTKAANYRLSLVTLDLKLEGKRVTKEFSNPRRYSFFLGPQSKAHTPEEYLVKKGRIKNLDDLKGRFSIEVVNKDFYRNIATLFTELAGGQRDIGSNHIDAGKGCLVLPASKDEQQKKEFAVRLIGRLVFCWFLKKKHLIPDDLLSVAALKNHRLYYHNILEPLFFETLNKPKEKRHKKYRNKVWDSVPFLNGGLFDPHEDDFYKFDEATGLSSQYINTLKVPDNILKDLLEIFEIYNFTIDENTPVDIELSIDPEMLGRIFENLLAEINPDTGETARRATGSYYTPREIVEYMVDESLKQYLITKTGKENEAAITSLLKYTDEKPDLDEDFEENVLDALYAVKVLDPACGSGAFPIGVLQKILLILQKIDPDSKRWLDRILDDIEDVTAREYLETHINADYVHKLGIIRDSIYGVDIQQIAVEISKLRVFLSLIIDESVSDSEPNRGIEPLPNLEFKFVCANTLIGLGKNINLTSTKAQRCQSKLEKLRKQYLSSYGDKKQSVIEEYNRTRSQLFEAVLLWTGTNERVRQLSTWDPFADKSCGWFDAHFMFGVDKRFDIVIGNPPYVDSETMKINCPDFRDYLRDRYISAKGNWDLFVVFIEGGLNLLADSGVFSFIVPNKVIAAKYTQALRTYLSTKSIIEIRDYSRLNVFQEADVYPVTLTIMNDRSYVDVKMTKMCNADRVDFTNIIRSSDFYKDILWDKYFLSEDCLNIMLAILHFPTLRDTAFDICGAATVNEAYRFKEVMNDSSKADGKRFINTGTIDRYLSLWGKQSTQYIKSSYTYPIVSNKDVRTISVRRFEQANSNKIIVAGMTKRIEAYYDSGVYLAGKSTSIIFGEQPMLKCLTCILNSSLIAFYVNNAFHSLKMAGGYINISKEILESIPYPPVSSGVVQVFSNLLDLIQAVAHERGESCGLFICLDNLINTAVCELFLQEIFKQHNCEIIKHLNCIPKVEGTCPNEKKISIVEKIQQQISASKHPLNVVLSKLKTIPEIRAIGRSAD